MEREREEAKEFRSFIRFSSSPPQRSYLSLYLSLSLSLSTRTSGSSVSSHRIMSWKPCEKGLFSGIEYRMFRMPSASAEKRGQAREFSSCLSLSLSLSVCVWVGCLEGPCGVSLSLSLSSRFPPVRTFERDHAKGHPIEHAAERPHINLQRKEGQE